MEPSIIGKYETRAVLGRGAMGTVFDAWDPFISRRVAIKTMSIPDVSTSEGQDVLHRFRREAQAAGRLSHPNIIAVHDYGEADGFAYIVMEFVEGTDVATYVNARERQGTRVTEVARLVQDVLTGLHYSHEHGVLHRDIKPANILVTNAGQVKICDFGVARIENSDLTQSGTMIGTPAYMSPEQLIGRTVDARSDIYSVGILMYQLLTGEKPFEGSLTSIIHKALNTRPPRPSDLAPDVPPALDPVVERAMARRPEDRFGTAAEFSEALRVAVAARVEPASNASMMSELASDGTRIRTGAAFPASTARPSAGAAKSDPERPQRRRRGISLLVGAAGLAAAFAVAGTMLLLRPTDQLHSVRPSSTTGAAADLALGPPLAGAALARTSLFQIT